MIRAGLCSITYRQLTAEQIVALAAAAGLEAIEWGGDVHVPPGDLEAAKRVRALTEQAGLQVASYGSYFRAGPQESVPELVATAQALGAPRIRVWAGRTGSADADAAHRRAVAGRIRELVSGGIGVGGIGVGGMGVGGIAVGLEFHGRTLTDSVDSTLALLAEIGQGCTTYWQPPVGMGEDDAAAGLERVLPQVSSVHVFSWWPGSDRQPLQARAGLWRRVFGLLASTGREHDALLEFVPRDDPELLTNEAACLRALIGGR